MFDRQLKHVTGNSTSALREEAKNKIEKQNMERMFNSALTSLRSNPLLQNHIKFLRKLLERESESVHRCWNEFDYNFWFKKNFLVVGTECSVHNTGIFLIWIKYALCTGSLSVFSLKRIFSGDSKLILMREHVVHVELLQRIQHEPDMIDSR